MRTAYNAISRNDIDVLARLFEALRKVSICLQEIVVFWDDHYGRLSPYSPRRDAAEALPIYGVGVTVSV
jgi:hypothetical protein